jgi:hypothetical protein
MNRRNIVGLSLLLAGACIFGAHRAAADPTSLAVTPGQFVVEPPTLINLGFEWYVDGDANRNATVSVLYKKAGDATGAWKTGLPLLRIQNEVNDQGAGGVYTSPNMFAGSIFDLDPDTDYQVILTMKDPDGVNGNAYQKVTVHTRPEPKPFVGGNVYHVYPLGFTGTRIQPAFTGLMAAYFLCASNGDGNKACRARVVPGDTIMVHAGTYLDDPFHYSLAGLGKPFDATYYLTAKGTAAKPISIVAAGDGPVIFDGGGNHNLFNVMAADYNYFEGLTIRNTDIAFWAGIKDIVGSTGLTVKKCRMENIGFGVWNEYAQSSNFYIADNTFIGREDPNLLFGWFAAPSTVPGTPSWQTIWNQYPNRPTSYPAPIFSYAAVKIYGSGNVVAYNSVARFHDDIDFDTHGLPEGYPDSTAGPSLTPRANMPVANDVYNNDVGQTADNCFETDGSMHNFRAMRSRCFNIFAQMGSSQPTFAGPTYYIRNVVYNDWVGAIKWSHAPGSLYYNNTFTTRLGGLTSGGSNQGSNFQFYNNLVLGQNAGEILVELESFTNYSVLDYNGYRPNDGAANSFQYNSPPFNVAADYNPANLVVRRYPTLAAYQQGTGLDLHSILIDWNVFNHASPPNPTNYTAIYDPATVDLTLNPSSAAVDAGTVLPNITDGYTGRAPTSERTTSACPSLTTVLVRSRTRSKLSRVRDGSPGRVRLALKAPAVFLDGS